MFSLIKKLVNGITLSRVLMWTLATAASILFYTAYENRNNIFHLFDSADNANQVGLTFAVGSATQEQTTQSMRSNRAIVAITIMTADLRLNETKSIFLASDNSAFNKIDAEYRKTGSIRVPLFTNIDDSNTDVIRLINGQFTCSSFESTLLSKIHPELKTSIKMICRSSIPSYYGYFSGFIEIYLRENISAEQQHQLKLMADKLSTDVYFRDVIPTQKIEQTDRRKTPFSPR